MTEDDLESSINNKKRLKDMSRRAQVKKLAQQRLTQRLKT